MKFTFNHIRILFFLVLGLLTFTSAVSQEDNSLLYKIEGNDIQPSYIYGTIHLLPQKDFNLKEKVRKAFDGSELIVLELDMDDPGMQIEMMQNISMKGDATLDQFFSEEDYKKLDAELKATMGMGIAPFNRMKPFMVSTMLLTKYIDDQPASFELTFVRMAADAKKEILGLETVTEQMAIFDAIPYQDQADDVAEMLNDEESTVDMFEDMIEIYKSEDIDELYEMFESYYEGEDDSMELMIHARNYNWITKIGEMAKEQSVFFGVGAGHLGGKRGVIQLLKNSGYTVSPILD
ncbi:MAG: TraB/GumN family protein [Bacteroidia bacterium]|nr:TraB/GumN family protein [Bacteroidia bacterium]